jgi:hypothetical protein
LLSDAGDIALAFLHDLQSRRDLLPPKIPRPDSGLYPCDGRVVPVLDLEPEARRSRLIGAIGALRNDALKPETAGVGEDRRAVTLKVVDVLKASIAVAQDSPQSSLALEERQATKIDSIDLHKVERQEARQGVVRAAVKRLEIGFAIRIEAGDFAIDHDGFDAQRQDRRYVVS